MCFELTINCISFGYVRLLNLNTIFLFCLFSYFFFSGYLLLNFSTHCTDSVRLTTAFGSDHPVVSRSGRKSNLIYTCTVCIYEGKNYRMFCMMYNSLMYNSYCQGSGRKVEQS